MKSLTERNKYFILLAIICLVCISFFLIPDTIFAHDTAFHIARIKGLAESIRHGEWLPEIFPEEYDNYGYGLPLFYCNAFLYLPAILNVLGVGLLWSYKIMMILLCVCAMAVAYYSVYQITKSDFSSFVTSALYIGSSYFASDFIERGALGELFGYAIFPVALLGFYRSAYGEYKRNYPLIIGFLGVCLAHNLSLVMYAVVFVLFILLNIAQYIKEPKRILYLFLDAAVVIMLAAVFLFPFIEQEMNAEFYSYYVMRESNPAWAALLIRNFFIQLIPSTSPYVPVLGVTMLIPFVLWLFSKKISAGNKLIRMRNVSFVISLICMFMCTGHFPYEKMDPLFNFIQFPWRWLMPITLLLSFCAGELVDELIQKKNVSIKLKNCIIVLFAVICSVQFLYRAVPSFKEYNDANPNIEYHFLSSDESHVKVADDIYLNRNNDREDWRNNRDGLPHIIGEDYQAVLIGKWEYDKYTLEYSGYQSGKGIEVPLTYYYGYKSVDSDGNEISVTPSYRGWLQVNPISDEGIIIVRYEKTFIQKISPWISLAALALVLAFENKCRKKT